MFNRSAKLLILTALLTWQAATPLQADYGYFEGHPSRYFENQPGGTSIEMTREVRRPLRAAALPGPVVAVDRQPVVSLYQPLQPWQPVEQAAVPGGQVPQAGLVGLPPATSFQRPVQRPVRLPTTPPRLSSPGPYQGVRPAAGQQLADGTWREDGRYIIININGRQVRLVKEAQIPKTPDAQDAPPQAEETGGTVCGRLLNHGQPLASCQVIIRPMTRRALGGYTFNPTVQPIHATTDAQGVYRFDNVPPGPYKLSWLPQGTNQWIRRIAMRPDLSVQVRETTQVKEVAVALRTIN